MELKNYVIYDYLVHAKTMYSFCVNVLRKSYCSILKTFAGQPF